MVAETCTVEGCGRPLTRRGFCNSHYMRWYKHGDPHAAGKIWRPRSNRKCTIDGCDKPHYGSGWCLSHYTRHRRHDDPTAGGTPLGAPLKWLLDQAAYEGNECIWWPFATAADGYGRVHFEGRSQIASRALCKIAHGPPPAPDLEAAHSCGNGKLGCVTKRHLRWATRQENEADKLLHGTHQRQLSQKRRATAFRAIAAE